MEKNTEKPITKKCLHCDSDVVLVTFISQSWQHEVWPLPTFYCRTPFATKKEHDAADKILKTDYY